VTARVGVITFPGTLDDVDAARAVRYAGAEAVSLWHRDSDLQGVDAVVVPGGFSYGDYLRAGAIAARSPVMGPVVEAAHRGLPVLGICNGFQILCEAGLLPGALARNSGLRFICREIRLRVENATTAWTTDLTAGAEITVPLKSGEGRFVADDETLARLEGEDDRTGRPVEDELEHSLRGVDVRRDARRHPAGELQTVTADLDELTVEDEGEGGQRIGP
jgi:phosphoribosylformylglycinamidine synthase